MPAFFAVSLPEKFTETTLLSEEAQARDLSVVLDGEKTAVRAAASPAVMDRKDLFKETVETETKHLQIKS